MFGTHTKHLLVVDLKSQFHPLVIISGCSVLIENRRKQLLWGWPGKQNPTVKLQNAEAEKAQITKHCKVEFGVGPQQACSLWTGGGHFPPPSLHLPICKMHSLVCFSFIQKMFTEPTCVPASGQVSPRALHLNVEWGSRGAAIGIPRDGDPRSGNRRG